MKSLSLRYSDTDAAWEFVSSKLLTCAFVVLIMIAAITALVPLSKGMPIIKSVLEITSAGAVGIGIAMLSTFALSMLGFVRVVQKTADEKGYIVNMPPLAIHLYESPREELSFHRRFVLFFPMGFLALAAWQMPPAIFAALIIGAGLYLTIIGGGWGRNLFGVPVLLFVLMICVSRPDDSIWYFVALLMGYFVVPRKFEGEEQDFERCTSEGQKEKGQEFVGGLVDGMLFGSIFQGGLIEASQGTDDAANIYGFGQNLDQAEEPERPPGNVSAGQKADSKAMLAAQEAKQAARRARSQTTKGE